MAGIELTAEEAEALRDLLEHHLSDLRMEIADTDRKDFREQLKERKELLRKIQAKLG